ncbi:MAG: hypothetical protein COA99_12690 [Moraxellaceae bacterium]|nr:MAG: hypothetical protein COA99_12690 [Moraxellaceae bacterium]
MKKSLYGIVIILCVLVAIVLTNALGFTSKQIAVDVIEPINIQEQVVAQNLAKALTFKTISHSDEKKVDGAQFLAFHQHLEKTFPKVHQKLNKEVVADYSLLFTWRGQDQELKPILLMAHQDVVPVASDGLMNWQQPPFGGKIADGFIWGRGALDNKVGVMGMLEAVELLLREGFQPLRTMVFAFGHDEEVGGRNGAKKIAALLKSRNITFEYGIDEGLVISEGIVPVPTPVAIIGIAEKGYLSLELSVTGEGGHSSLPPAHTAIGVLSAAIKRLEENQMPGKFSGVVAQTFDYIAPEMIFKNQILFSNIWLFRPILEPKLAENKAINASLRTTTAVTMFNAGIKDNVLPTEAKAIVNFRILPGDDLAGVIEHVNTVIGNTSVLVRQKGVFAQEPSDISETSSRGFQLVQKTINQIYPGVIVAPGLVMGVTDSRHYADLIENIYRFSPLQYKPEDINRLHGLNERISVAHYSDAVRFYTQLIRQSVTK